MAFSKIILNGQTLMDATSATATAADIASPKTAMLADGVMTTGTGSGGGGTTWVELYNSTISLNRDNPSDTTSYFIINNWDTPIGPDETYRVTWGTSGTYTCQSYVTSDSSSTDGYAVGNASMVGGTDTGEPFIFTRQWGNYLVGDTPDAAGNILLKIEKQVSMTLTTKTITANGTYSAEDDNALGYSEVTVNVSGGQSGTWQIVHQGTYTITDDGDTGYIATNCTPFDSIESGTIWRVTWNNTVYTMTATEAAYVLSPDFALGYGVGNIAAFGGTTGNNEPFAMACFNFWGDYTLTFLTLADSGDVSLMVEKFVPAPTGLEYEEGTYTPASDVAMPTISFANTHTNIPACIIMADSTGTDDQTSNTNYGFVFGSLSEIGGTKVPNGTNGRFDTGSYIYRATGNPSQVAFGVTKDTGSSSSAYRGYWVSNTEFIPSSNSSTRYWRSGRTYKWIAIWAPST